MAFSDKEGLGARELVGDFVTNSDGRLASGPALKGAAFTTGVYEWTFFAGDYFAAKAVPSAGQPFLDVVPLRCFRFIFALTSALCDSFLRVGSPSLILMTIPFYIGQELVHCS